MDIRKQLRFGATIIHRSKISDVFETGWRHVLICHSKMSLLMLATCGRRFVENSVINLWFRTGLYAKSHGEKKLSVETNFAAMVGFYD